MHDTTSHRHSPYSEVVPFFPDSQLTSLSLYPSSCSRHPRLPLSHFSSRHSRYSSHRAVHEINVPQKKSTLTGKSSRRKAPANEIFMSGYTYTVFFLFLPFRFPCVPSVHRYNDTAQFGDFLRNLPDEIIRT